MKEFKLILDVTNENDVENFSKTTWRSIAHWGNNSAMELIDCLTDKVILSGDVYGEDISFKMEIFLAGLEYGIGPIELKKYFRKGNKLIEVEEN